MCKLFFPSPVCKVEVPERLTVSYGALGEKGLADRCVSIPVREATDADILLIHRSEGKKPRTVNSGHGNEINTSNLSPTCSVSVIYVPNSEEYLEAVKKTPYMTLEDLKEFTQQYGDVYFHPVSFRLYSLSLS